MDRKLLLSAKNKNNNNKKKRDYNVYVVFMMSLMDRQMDSFLCN